MKLDNKDKKILSILDLEARESYQRIAKRVGLSKETVIYRINRLKQNNVIGRYTTLVNFSKLGRSGYAVFNRFHRVDEKLKSEIIEYLKNIPELYWIALLGGKYDIVFAFMCKSINEFNKLYYQVLNKYGKHLTENTISIRTELRQYKRTYLSGNLSQFKAPVFGKEPQIIKLDKVDIEILNILSNNARISIVNLSKVLKKSQSTLTWRIKQLKDKEIIQGFSTYIKSQNFGMQSYRLLLNLEGMDEKTRSSLFEYVNNGQYMILAIETVGQWNFEITLEVENHLHLQKEILKLRNKFDKVIKHLEFIIMFEDDLVYDPYPLEKLKRK